MTCTVAAKPVTERAGVSSDTTPAQRHLATTQTGTQQVSNTVRNKNENKANSYNTCSSSINNQKK